MISKRKRLIQRKKRVRAKVFGTKQMPRLSIFRSNKYVYGQLIDDQKGTTVLSISEKKLESKVKATKTEKAKLLGIALALLAKKEKISRAVFDRSGYKYHGRVKAFAEGAREGGLKI